ncbi:hypothetical protein VP1G_04549 [Cytospora mali]|uniref:Pru domain-containing protein n=1 Tax=Cytospora mali TaxID=578113 RepID=A0A194UZX0_CYTMA|nr:hypothetical protein VP1G_04549 [Valsa mali var. pyri (nom. inval.)]
MSIRPIITFKAGICEVDQSSKPYKVKPSPRSGYIYLYQAPDDDLLHFCWRERSVPADQPELDLTMIPGDGTFIPVESSSSTPASAKANGRVFVLKFESSSTRHLFWLQSHPQSSNGDPTWLSPRDRRIGEVVNRLLQGDEFDVNAELAAVRSGGGAGRDGDGDENMEDAEDQGDEHNEPGTGGAGADATGGDVREEGEGAREGGSDGARAASNVDAAAAVRNFLASLNQGGKGGMPGSQQSAEGKAYPLLNDLLETSTTIPMVKSADEEQIDNLLSYLPPVVLVLAQQGVDSSGDSIDNEPSSDSAAAAIATMNLAQKKSLLEKVLRSPQFHQSLASLTMALRDGGLPSISEALGVKVDNGGYMRGGSMPLGGGDAVEAFVEGVKKNVQEKK